MDKNSLEIGLNRINQFNNDLLKVVNCTDDCTDDCFEISDCHRDNKWSYDKNSETIDVVVCDCDGREDVTTYELYYGTTIGYIGDLVVFMYLSNDYHYGTIKISFFDKKNEILK